MNAMIDGDCATLKANCLDSQGADIDKWCSDQADFGRDAAKAREEFGDQFDWEVASVKEDGNRAEVTFIAPDGTTDMTETVILENGA